MTCHNKRAFVGDAIASVLGQTYQQTRSCGTGAFTFYAASIGNEALGISNDAADIEKARTRATQLGLHSAHFREIDFLELSRFGDELGLFDRILLLDALYFEGQGFDEPAEPIQAALAGVAALLRPGGKLLISTPSANHGYVFAPAAARAYWGTGQHTHQQIREWLEACGWRVIEEGHNVGIVTQWLTNIWRRLETSHGLLARALILPMRPRQRLDRPFNRLLRYPAKDIVVVATR